MYHFALLKTMSCSHYTYICKFSTYKISVFLLMHACNHACTRYSRVFLAYVVCQYVQISIESFNWRLFMSMWFRGVPDFGSVENYAICAYFMWFICNYYVSLTQLCVIFCETHTHVCGFLLPFHVFLVDFLRLYHRCITSIYSPHSLSNDVIDVLINCL